MENAIWQLIIREENNERKSIRGKWNKDRSIVVRSHDICRLLILYFFFTSKSSICYSVKDQFLFPIILSWIDPLFTFFPYSHITSLSKLVLTASHIWFHFFVKHIVFHCVFLCKKNYNNKICFFCCVSFYFFLIPNHINPPSRRHEDVTTGRVHPVLFFTVCRACPAFGAC